MRFVGLFMFPALLLVSGFVPGPLAQETEPAEPQTEAATAETGEDSKKKLPFALYVEAGTGVVSADDINPSIQTSPSRTSQNLLILEDQVYYRAAVGWKLPKGKGEFRLLFNGYKEDGYEFSALGRLGAVTPSAPVADNFVYWIINAKDGTLSTSRFSVFWEKVLDDANGNSLADLDEVRTSLDYSDTRTMTDNLQNRVQSVDILYGRSFGKRRYTARWWGGLRYFTYDGNIPAAAWIKPTGVFYTDGFLIRFINFSQEASGAGPTGALEADFNFFDNRLTFFLGGQFAFILSDIATDSGEFFTLVGTDPPESLTKTIPARLTEERNKSTWHDTAEAGVRIKLKSGLQLELAYAISGFLDVIILPTAIQIPQDEFQGIQGTAAIYNTQDIVLDGWRAGISFQF